MKPQNVSNFLKMTNMNFKDIDDTEQNGFSGFKTVAELWIDKSSIPKTRGVYLVINPKYNKTEFINPGVGGFFKGKDPNVSIACTTFWG